MPATRPELAGAARGCLSQDSDSPQHPDRKTLPTSPPASCDGWSPTVTVDRRPVLLQVFDERYLPLHHLTGPRTREWAKTMGCRYHPHLIMGDTRHIHYVRWEQILAELGAGNAVWYLDVDVLPIRNEVIDPGDVAAAFSQDGKGLCCGAMYLDPVLTFFARMILKRLPPAKNQAHLLEQNIVKNEVSDLSRTFQKTFGYIPESQISNPCSPGGVLGVLHHCWANGGLDSAIQSVKNFLATTKFS